MSIFITYSFYQTFWHIIHLYLPVFYVIQIVNFNPHLHNFSLGPELNIYVKMEVEFHLKDELKRWKFCQVDLWVWYLREEMCNGKSGIQAVYFYQYLYKLKYQVNYNNNHVELISFPRNRQGHGEVMCSDRKAPFENKVVENWTK